MSLPTLTNEQRKAALAKAGAVRKARAEFKQQVARGEITATEALSQALESPEVLGRLLVAEFLRCIPGIGARRAQSTVDKIGIAHNRRLSGVGKRQLRELLAVCSSMDNKVNA
ncbi:MAG TPA: integration host factor, actinobacterial type [Corynebacterium sp.]|nr:integration host factor, actinobacterial type [Corynebacterium sp.]